MQVRDIALVSVGPELVKEGSYAVLKEAEDGEVAGMNCQWLRSDAATSECPRKPKIKL